MADKEKKQVTASPMEGMSEATQTLVKSLANAQERNLKYAQSVFESTIALLKEHAESTRALLEQWEQQAQKGQGGSAAAGTYASFFSAPLNAYEQVLKMVETTSRQSMENFEKATESFQEALKRGQEQWQEATKSTPGGSENPKQ
jgi:DNA repair exonuclease SbcCD ATPase subunit